jgi:hypothetical protein
VAVDNSVLASIISASGALVVGVLGYVFTKKAEREAAWRNEKLRHYKEFVASLSGIVGRTVTDQAKIRFAQACNDLLLFAPDRVISALRSFQDETATSNPSPDPDRHDRVLSELLIAIRRDLGLRDRAESFSARLWAASLSAPAGPAT